MCSISMDIFVLTGMSGGHMETPFYNSFARCFGGGVIFLRLFRREVCFYRALLAGWFGGSCREVD